MKKLTLLIATAVSILTTPALLAQMNHGNHGNHGTQQHGAAAQQPAALPAPVKSVFDNYLKIQTSLAQDFVQGVNDVKALKDRSLAIADAVRKDPANTFPAEVAQQAEALAKAEDLQAARKAFKPLSDSLIKYLDGHKDQAGHFEKVFCSMASARWLQKTGTPVSNPYYGKSMLRCGQIES